MLNYLRILYWITITQSLQVPANFAVLRVPGPLHPLHLRGQPWEPHPAGLEAPPLLPWPALVLIGWGLGPSRGSGSLQKQSSLQRGPRLTLHILASQLSSPLSMNPWIMKRVFLSVLKLETSIVDGSATSSYVGRKVSCRLQLYVERVVRRRQPGLGSLVREGPPISTKLFATILKSLLSRCHNIFAVVQLGIICLLYYWWWGSHLYPAGGFMCMCVLSAQNTWKCYIKYWEIIYMCTYIQI